MAKAAAKKAQGGGGGGFFMPVLLATLLVGAGGAFFGLQVPAILNQALPQKEKPAEKPKAEGEGEGAKIMLRELAPITTNLASPANTWIRMETAAVITQDLGPEGPALIAKLNEDIVAYLRTVPLEQIEGPSGFQHLREDLNDRVRIRSQGKVSELLIQALVVQ